MRLQSFGITDVGLKRSHNEDNFFRSDDMGLYLVADGMGGHAAGEVASGSAIQTIGEFFDRHLRDTSLTWPFGYNSSLSASANALVNGVRLANQRLYALQQERTELSGMGTTIAAVELTGPAATIAHVGDSRAYRMRGGAFEQLTLDHSWVNEQLQKNIITADEARNHRYRNVITRALGNRLDLEIDVRVEPIEAGDLFLICSDGLSTMVEDDDIAVIARETPDLRECANKLVARANEAGGHDNITVVLARADG